MDGIIMSITMQTTGLRKVVSIFLLIYSTEKKKRHTQLGSVCVKPTNLLFRIVEKKNIDGQPRVTQRAMCACVLWSGRTWTCAVVSVVCDDHGDTNEQ